MAEQQSQETNTCLPLLLVDCLGVAAPLSELSPADKQRSLAAELAASVDQSHLIAKWLKGSDNM